MRRLDLRLGSAAAAALLVVLASPANAQAQSTGCDAPPRRAVAPGVYVGPEFAVATSDGVVVFGDIRYRFVRAVREDSLEVDSAFVGVRILADGSGRLVKAPTGRERMRSARVGVRGDSVRVVFFAPRTDGRDADSLLTLWDARLVGVNVVEVRGVGEVGRRGTFDRQRSGDLTAWRGGEHLLLPADWSGSGALNLAHASMVRGERRLELVRTAVLGVTYTDLFADADALRAVMIALPGDQATASGPDIWLSEFDGSVWSPARRIVRGRGDMLMEPRLFRNAGGLILAYLRLTPVGRRTLEWTGVEETSRASAHAIPVVGRLQKGQQDLSDLVSVADSESTAVILRLRATGADTLARLRTRGSFSPLLTGRRVAPLALTFDDDQRTRTVPFHLVQYDLSCLAPRLGRAQSAPPG